MQTMAQARMRIRKVFNFGYAAKDGYNGQWYWYFKMPVKDIANKRWKLQDTVNSNFTIPLHFMNLTPDVKWDESLIVLHKKGIKGWQSSTQQDE